MTRWPWRSIWSASLAASLTLCAARGATQTPDRACDPADPKSCVQAVTEGQVVPFTGVLMTLRRAAKLGVAAEGCQERVELAVEREQELAQVKLLGERQLRENDRQTSQLQVDLLQRRMAELAPAWYERPAFVAPLTAALTVAVLVLSVKTVQALR